MTRGSYAFGDGSVETFACGSGPSGWRYTAGAGVDLVLDDDGRLLRGTLGGWRAAEVGAVLTAVSPDGRELAVPGAVLLGASPGAWLALLRRVRPADGGAEPSRVTVLHVDGPAALTRRLLVRGLAEDGFTTVTADDADTAERTVLHVAGDLLLAGEGPGWQVELAALDPS